MGSNEEIWDLSPWFTARKPRSPNPNKRHVLHRKQNGLCYYCGKPTPIEKFTREHMMPRCMGGRGQGNNVGACNSCNHAKGSMTFEEFLQTDYLPNARRTLLGYPNPPCIKFQHAKKSHAKRIEHLNGNVTLKRPLLQGFKYRPLG